MTAVEPATDHNYWQKQADQYLIKGNYSQAASVWVAAVEAEPLVRSHYWHLGLMLLLQEQEEEAQTTWLLGMAEGEPEQVEQWTIELIQLLQTEAERQEALTNYTVAWGIRQHLREINPAEINNLLNLVCLGVRLERLTGEELADLGVIDFLKLDPPVEVEPQLLLLVLHNLLDFAPLHPLSLEFTRACLGHIREHQVLIDILIPAAIKVAYSLGQPIWAARLAELALQIDPQNVGVLLSLSSFYQNANQYAQGIETAKLCYSLVQTLAGKIVANYILIRGLMNPGGYWEEAVSIFQEQESLHLSLIEESTTFLEESTVLSLVNSAFFRPYFQDQPKKNREIQNQVSQFCYHQIRHNLAEPAQRYSQSVSSRQSKLVKIGYLSHCLRRHSVGWITQGLFKHHDRDRFEINAYFIAYKQNNDPVQEWYVNHVSNAYKGGVYGLEIAEKIYEDKIDILIDLDSITLDISCEILALKPAPVQATWLGWDASGMPSIDYFIADPYVLPDSAQEYYREKIWRLPQTYIAVDGFEIGKPTLRRDILDIPSDAVVYFSGQKGYKRHPNTAKLQMKIIKDVPNSYFLIKCAAQEESIKNFFIQIAEEEGVDTTRLRFLGQDPSEAVYRANLGIADIVLDTYPYNGATTTLEVLWMGIPLVTRVGEQFSARNSYTMMLNAGITEGIAWTDQEYIEWGILLGKDIALRQQVVWKLHQSRQTAPLWNAQQFAREMESAYEQMWTKYIQS